MLTLFLQTEAPETIDTVKQKLLQILAKHDTDNKELAGITADRVRLYVQEPSSQPPSFQLLDDSDTVQSAELKDEQVVYFAFRHETTWEEPYFMDYDSAEPLDMEVDIQ